jgi:NADH:ubiquinone oxidoreductase subunit 2 (subunit N)
LSEREEHNGHTLTDAKEDNSIFRLASVGTTWLIIDRVQPQQKNSGIRRIAKSAIAGLLILSWLFVAVLSFSPSLHQYFHHDADSAEHSCAVTLFAHGKVTAASAPPVLVFFVSLLLFCVPLVKLAEFSSFDLRLDFGRAPPHFFGLP